MTTNGYGISFRWDENVLELVMVIQLEYSKNHRIVHFVDFMASALCLNKKTVIHDYCKTNTIFTAV